MNTTVRHTRNRSRQDFLEEIIVVNPLRLVLKWREADGVLVGMDLRWADDATQTPELSKHARAVRAELEKYVAGEQPQWPELPLDMDSLPPFSRLALETLRREAGYGAVISYGQLAAMCGNPKAARAVGQAMARNPFPLIIPCHRVLGGAGRLHGFGGGLPMKAYLLDIEGVEAA